VLSFVSIILQPLTKYKHPPEDKFVVDSSVSYLRYQADRTTSHTTIPKKNHATYISRLDQRRYMEILILTFMHERQRFSGQNGRDVKPEGDAAF
jgi:hypothetical protein